MKKKKAAKKKRPAKKEKKPKSNYWAKFLASLAIVASVASILSLLLSVLPRLVVSPTAPLNPSDAFSTLFAISNEGYTGVNGVKTMCAVKYAKTTPDPLWEIKGTDDYKSRFTSPDLYMPRLTPGNQDTVNCTFISPTFAARLEYADVALIFSYRPDWYPLYREKGFRFVTAKESNGKLRWIQKPYP